MFTWVLGRYVTSTVLACQYPNFSEGADCVGGQLRGDKECPFSGVNQIWQSLEEGAEKRCSECDMDAVVYGISDGYCSWWYQL